VTDTERSLEVQRREFASRRFLAMPLAGTVAWLIVAAGAVLAPRSAWPILFITTGSIAYLGIALSKLTGEDFLEVAAGLMDPSALDWHLSWRDAHRADRRGALPVPTAALRRDPAGDCRDLRPDDRGAGTAVAQHGLRQTSGGRRSPRRTRLDADVMNL
jgi:hypothetical protein